MKRPDLAERNRRPRPDLTQRNREQHRGEFLYEDPTWMREAYVERELSLRQIAAEASCGVRTAARWLAFHGVPTRSMSEGRRLNPITGERSPSWKGGPPKCDCGATITRKRGVTMCIDCRNASFQGSGNPKWRGDAIEYPAAHDRVKKARGLASTHTCQDCGGPAAHWAYDHQDPNEKTDLAEGPYSLDIQRYMPLCVKCHKRFDMAYLKASGSP